MDVVTTINFRGYLHDVRSRLLWQQLFNFYRENNCPLDHLDNILIDLRNCVEAIDMTYDGPVEFLWGCDPGYYHTTWIRQQQWDTVGIDLMINMSSIRWFVHCRLTHNEAIFTKRTGPCKTVF